VSACLNRTTDHTARPVVPDEPGLQSTNCDGHGKCASMRAESDRAPGEVDRSVGPSVLGGCSVWKALSHSSCRFGLRRDRRGGRVGRHYGRLRIGRPAPDVCARVRSGRGRLTHKPGIMRSFRDRSYWTSRGPFQLVEPAAPEGSTWAARFRRLEPAGGRSMSDTVRPEKFERPEGSPDPAFVRGPVSGVHAPSASVPRSDSGSEPAPG